MKDGKKQIWGNHLGTAPDELMVRFCAGRDVATLPMADEALIPYDLWTNRAHAIMLERQGIISTDHLKAILKALGTLESNWRDGRFTLDPTLEDVHINIEKFVSAIAGEDAGGRLHTGRSRNDQVACDMRLYMRSSLLEVGEGLVALAKTLMDQARDHAGTTMPGFSHHQPAMITTWGHWLCAYIQAILRDLERIRFAIDQINRNPLGAAAAFGTSWPIDRALTTHLLAFQSVDLNTLDCISARWENEAQVAQSIAFMMGHFSLIAQDLILLSHPYWEMIRLSDAFVTGSSIMPQKRNPDFAEVIKGKTAWVNGIVQGLMGTPHGAMSGYNRDSQLTKYAVMDVINECLVAPAILKGVFETLEVKAEKMKTRLEKGFLMATDFADRMARELNLPFRACYDLAASAVQHSGDAGVITPEGASLALREQGQDPEVVKDILSALANPDEVVSWREHAGAPSNVPVRVQIETYHWQLSRLSDFIPRMKSRIELSYNQCRDFTPGQ